MQQPDPNSFWAFKLSPRFWTAGTTRKHSRRFGLPATADPCCALDVPKPPASRSLSFTPPTGRETAGVRCSWFPACENVQLPSPAVRAFLFLPFFLLLFLSCSSSPNHSVVVYASQDQVYAEAILSDFSRATGIRVRPVFDSEAVKTVGLANRLLAERSNPQCDVFWNNEELRTRQLHAQSLFRVEKPWAAFGFRSRRIVINTNHLTPDSAPRSLADLTNTQWHGKIALAYPLFGTTATHFLALRQLWGETAWLKWCQALNANKPFLVDGNSVVVQLVARGEAWIGLTDFDDIAAAQRQALPVAAMPLAQDAFLIPNTVAVLRDAPHPAAAQQLFDYLQSKPVLEKLAALGALEGLQPDGSPVLNPDWNSLLENLEPATTQLKEIFLR